jgi:L-fuculose-phosphate aldolase
MMTELDLRKAICEVGRRLYARNLVAATDGNISVRLGPDRYLCTPSGVSKGFMAPRDLLVAEERPDVSAVVHAHPPKAIGFTLAGVSLADCVLPEVVYSIGGVPTTAYATPATREGSEVIREHIRGCDALLMDRHGALTVGVNVYDALNKMEKIEHAAETLLTARLLGRVRPLEAGEVEKLYGVREDYGVSGKVYRCAVCEECPKGVCPVEDNSRLDRVVSETLHVLGGA